ncbi:Neuroligin-3 [Branchiostoma belcheri]|nr:Neuroligin-3 [Branchiostoma belcheri]
MFCFLSTEDGNAQGNYGLSDQIKALEWVNSYISFFGGNPHNIVIFGSGTGAAVQRRGACSDLFGYDPESNPDKFRRGISMSGSALATWAMSRNGRAYATAAAKQVNCDSSDTKTMVDCLRGKSADVLANISTSIVEPSRYYFAFAPVVDYLIIPSDPTRLTTKNMSNLPHDYMVGVTESDGFMYVDGVKGVGDDGINKDDFEGLVDNFVQQVFQSRQPEIKDAVTFSYTDWSDRNNDIKRRKSTVALFTDYFFVQPAVTTLNAIAPVLKGNTYFYAFLYRGEVGFGPDWAAAVHGEELPFIFGAPVGTVLGRGALYSFSNFTKQDNMYSVALMTYWTNFAKTGNPNLPGMQKPSFLGIRPNKFEEWLPKVQTPSQMATPPGQPDLSKCPNYPPTRGTSNPRDRWRPRPGSDVLIGRGTKSPPVQSSSRELNVTIAVGASLLLINIIVFIVVNYRRIDCAAYRKRKKRTDKKKKLNANHSGSIPSVRILEIGNLLETVGHLWTTTIQTTTSNKLLSSDNTGTQADSASAAERMVSYRSQDPNQPEEQSQSFMHQATNVFRDKTWPAYNGDFGYLYVGKNAAKTDRKYYRAAKVAFWVDWVPHIAEPRNDTDIRPGNPQIAYPPMKCPVMPTSATEAAWTPKSSVPEIVRDVGPPQPQESNSSRLSFTISIGIVLFVVNLIVFSMWLKWKKKIKKEEKANKAMTSAATNGQPRLQEIEEAVIEERTRNEESTEALLEPGACRGTDQGEREPTPSPDSGIKTPLNSSNDISGITEDAVRL